MQDIKTPPHSSCLGSTLQMTGAQTTTMWWFFHVKQSLSNLGLLLHKMGFVKTAVPMTVACPKFKSRVLLYGPNWNMFLDKIKVKFMFIWNECAWKIDRNCTSCCCSQGFHYSTIQWSDKYDPKITHNCLKRAKIGRKLITWEKIMLNSQSIVCHFKQCSKLSTTYSSQ